MIERVYEAVQHAEQVTDVIVATDDDRIYQAVQSFRGKAVMTSGENRSGTDRVAEAARHLNLSSDDIIINVQGDQPLLDPRSIDELVAPFFSGSNPNMTTLAFKIVNRDEITNPKDVKVTFDHKGFALYFSRSPIPFGRDASYGFDTYKHLGFYAYKKEFLDTFSRLPDGKLERIEKLEQLRAIEYGYRVLVIVTAYDSPEVDYPEDIPRIEAILKQRPEK